MRDFIKRFLKKILGEGITDALFSFYHFVFAWGAACWYGLPARKLYVIGVTGTKGKSSTCEMINAILEEAGYRTVLASTIRFKSGNESRPNTFKMTMPGRGHLQKMLREGARAGATHAVVELTSEGARQHRDVATFLNALVFTNIAPEHIESHGSYENYKEAKLGIGHSLVHSFKRPRTIVANAEDEIGKKMLAFPVEHSLPFSLTHGAPYASQDTTSRLTFRGVTFEIPFPGEFSIKNALAALTLAESLGIAPEVGARALSHMKPILGRVGMIQEGQSFLAVVDYAHTIESLQALYGAFPGRRKICVLGNTGGGRDRWKRPAMGQLADESCAEVILTDEDPYDENPDEIVREMASGMKRTPTVIMDRRKAIRHALTLARVGDAVLITGKGTDPYIMGAKGKKTPWSDAGVVREELRTLRKEVH